MKRLLDYNKRMIEIVNKKELDVSDNLMYSLLADLSHSFANGYFIEGAKKEVARQESILRDLTVIEIGLIKMVDGDCITATLIDSHGQKCPFVLYREGHDSGTIITS